MTKASSLQVVPGTAQTLTPQQKKFNTLMQRIGKQRDLLRDWKAAIDLFRQRHTSELLPLAQQETRLKTELVKVFDGLSAQKMAKADLAYLQVLIGDYIHEVLDDCDDEAERTLLKSIYARHASVDFDTEQAALDREQDAMARVMVEKMFGVELDEDELATPDTVLRKLQAQMEEQHTAQQAQQTREDTSSARAQRKPSARERNQQAAAQLISQSVREIYRKLASSLHPDREPDPVERERKNALMQRVNQAYNAGQLLQLLELQLEIEQIDTDHIAGLSEERLKHYNQVLSEQHEELKQEVKEVEHSFLMQYELSPMERYTPKKIGQIFNRDLAYQQRLLKVLANQLKIFTEEPQVFKRWLKEERALQREHERRLMDQSFSFYY